MVHDYHVMSMESILFKLQDVTFCNKKTFPLLNNVVYTLLHKKSSIYGLKLSCLFDNGIIHNC